ncbi:hypothetical protein [Longimicrobium sp.]|jgi:dipeptidyl aminopeptidase/acylaminoacyl peptidase|uniref:TolB family protein n=1 Tax=Longimicrobium sp. TaxID=2029185 RepID=UPI002ED8C6DF
MLLVLAACAAPLHGQRVEAVNGGIVYRPPCSAPARRLTQSGMDSEPRLSPTGTRIVFLRRMPGGSGQSAVWVMNTDGSGARMLVRPREDDAPVRNLTEIKAPQFSPDGMRVYFLASAWATSNAVHQVDVATGAERYLIPGNTLEVVPAGDYAGHLLVNQHRYFLAGGSYDWEWLFTPQGREVGPVGETEEAQREFRAGIPRRPAARCR